ncbi:hypothetical protein DMENIID0001_151560 [Sergentomyia squamirostris]
MQSLSVSNLRYTLLLLVITAGEFCVFLLLRTARHLSLAALEEVGYEENLFEFHGELLRLSPYAPIVLFYQVLHGLPVIITFTLQAPSITMGVWGRCVRIRLSDSFNAPYVYIV